MALEIRTSTKILFSIIVTLIFLLFFEIGARVFEYVYPDEIDIGIEVAEKKPGSFRIFLYGGSTVWGAPESRFGFVKQLAFWLDETHRAKPLEIINFAVKGEDSTFVRAMIDRTMRYDPDLLIVLSGHNEFLMDSLPEKGWREKVIYSFALTRVLFKFKEGISDNKNSLKIAFDLTSHTRRGIDRESEDFRSRVRNYQKNIKAIARTAGANGVPLFFLTAPNNMADWPPVYKELEGYGPDYEAGISEAMDFLTRGRLTEASEKVALLEGSFPNDAMLFFLKGRLKQARGDYAGASLLFKRAKEMDPIPWRVLSLFNETVREAARGEKGVYLLDVFRLFEENSDNGLIGFDLVADNCHPTPVGNALIAGGIFSLMKEHSLFVERSMPRLSAGESLKYFFKRTFKGSMRSGVEYDYILSNAKYTMKSPFYNFAASKMYLDRALALDRSDWVVWANLATISFFEGETARGIEELEKAASLKGRPINAGDRANTPHLLDALKLRNITAGPESGN